MKEKSIKTNALLNSLKQVSAVVFPLISIPYVTRILGTENYGKVSFANSIVNYFLLFAALGITNYTAREGAPLRKDKQKFEAFASQIFTINVISTLISYAGLFCLLLIPQLRTYRTLILIQSLSIAFTTLGADWINTIFEDFGYIAIRYVIAQAAALAAMFAFVRTKEDYLIYAGIMVLANSGVNLLNIWYIKRYVRLHLTRHLQLRIHLKPLLMLLANSLAITIYINSDVTILGFFAGDHQVGVYSLASRIYLTVKQVLNAVIVVAVPRLSVLYTEDRERYQSLLNKILNYIVTILMPVLVGLFMLSKETMTLAGGEAYAEGYHSLQILSIALLFAVLGCFFSNCILLPAKKDQWFLKSTLTGAIVNIVLNFAAIPLLGINGAALTTVIGEMTVCTMVFIAGRQITGCHMEAAAIRATAAGCAGIVIVCLLCRLLTDHILLYAGSAIVLSAAVYALFLLTLNRTMFMDLFGRFKPGRH